jgi:hypothetical protein
VEAAEKAETEHAQHEGKSLPVHVDLLDPHNYSLMTEGTLILWSRFLYGQPMTPSSNDRREFHVGVAEFEALLQVHKLSLKYDHADAEDASIDAIRDLIHYDDNSL